MHKPDSARTVKVEFVCDRTGKTDNVDMPLDAVENFYKNKEERAKTAALLNKELTSLAKEKMPDLIVYFRGRLVVLGNINPKHDNMIERHLHEVTNHEVFPAVEPTNKRTRKNAVKETPDT